MNRAVPRGLLTSHFYPTDPSSVSRASCRSMASRVRLQSLHRNSRSVTVPALQPLDTLLLHLCFRIPIIKWGYYLSYSILVRTGNTCKVTRTFPLHSKPYVLLLFLPTIQFNMTKSFGQEEFMKMDYISHKNKEVKQTNKKQRGQWKLQ